MHGNDVAAEGDLHIGGIPIGDHDVGLCRIGCRPVAAILEKGGVTCLIELGGEGNVGIYIGRNILVLAQIGKQCRYGIGKRVAIVGRDGQLGARHTHVCLVGYRGGVPRVLYRQNDLICIPSARVVFDRRA